jgi:6-pyruvoyltetrahydropterin/6-carboxytetrahydropterin synthase
VPQITRTFEFDSGHRVLGHEGKCRNLHGHRYRAEVTVRAPALDPLGRVVDFAVVKERVGRFLDEEWDHNLLLHPDDPLAGEEELVGRAPYALKRGNPTAENLAAELFEAAQERLPGLTVVRVRLWETPTCYSDYPEEASWSS